MKEGYYTARLNEMVGEEVALWVGGDNPIYGPLQRHPEGYDVKGIYFREIDVQSLDIDMNIAIR